jgi:DNA-binding transcriptional LysR family regulator
MQDLNDLYYFVSVVDHGGFAAAGRALGLQKSKLSRRILQMEERLGVRLLNRSSRRFSVTDTGRRFYDRCVAMLVEAEAAEQVIAQVRAEPRGVVRMSCTIGLLNFQFGALIAKFMVANPAVEVHLESTNRPVDVIAEGFDVAIRVRFPPLEPVRHQRSLDRTGGLNKGEFLAHRNVHRSEDETANPTIEGTG